MGEAGEVKGKKLYFHLCVQFCQSLSSELLFPRRVNPITKLLFILSRCDSLWCNINGYGPESKSESKKSVERLLLNSVGYGSDHRRAIILQHPAEAEHVESIWVSAIQFAKAVRQIIRIRLQRNILCFPFLYVKGSSVKG